VGTSTRSGYALAYGFRGRIFMQIALMMPCYIDFFYPEVGVAALEVLDL
jgi:hypothetical protein